MTFGRIDEIKPYDILSIKLAMIKVVSGSTRRGRRNIKGKTLALI
jgi:hypothetical protein